MSTPFLGEVIAFGFTFTPRFYAACNGGVLPIAQNSALFALLGTTYGGNGVTTFALPDLRGRAVLGFGSGPGLTTRTQGEVGGAANVTLLTGQMPSHTHSLSGVAAAGTTAVPGGNVLASNITPLYSASAGSAMNAASLATAGGSQPHSNEQPYGVLNYCIAVAGIFPSRS
jgi:microcystin-dependent protein